MRRRSRPSSKTISGVQDVASDLQLAGSQMMIEINRDLAARVGMTPAAIESTLYGAFGRRYVMHRSTDN